MGLFLVGCGEILCTQIGCLSGLIVRFDGDLVQGDRVELELGGTSPWVFECDASDCGNTVHFPDVMADRAMIYVTTAKGQVVHEVFPEYERVTPNGPDCGGCDAATLELTLP